MNLVAIENRNEISAAIKLALDRVKSIAIRARAHVVFRPSSVDMDVYWSDALGIWAGVRWLENRPWMPLGRVDPRTRKSVFITLEINPGFHGSPIAFGGLVARDDQSRVYLCHTGMMGGGKTGLTKKAFLDYFCERVVSVALADGRSADVAVIGCVTAPRFALHLAAFIHSAAEYKEGRPPPPAPDSDFSGFQEESVAKRRGYTPAPVDPICDHPLVVNALAALLKSRGMDVGNDRKPVRGCKRDLFVRHSSGSLAVLFEVKTDSTPTAIYEAIGQLLMYSAYDDPAPRRVLVIPAETASDSIDRLMALGFHPLRFGWHGSTPQFADLDEILRKT